MLDEGGKNMKTFTVHLEDIEKVKAFVNVINTFDGDFDLKSDRYIVDAKSIMGIFSLDISKPLILEAHEGAVFDEEKLAAFIK